MKTHRFTFTRAHKRGPWVKVFTASRPFAGYVTEWSRLTGVPVVWVTPFDVRAGA